MLLADPNVVPISSLAVRSATGGWSGSGVDAELADRVGKHALCHVALVGLTGTPSHVPVATVFQFFCV